MVAFLQVSPNEPSTLSPSNNPVQQVASPYRNTPQLLGIVQWVACFVKNVILGGILTHEKKTQPPHGQPLTLAITKTHQDNSYGSSNWSWKELAPIASRAKYNSVKGLLLDLDSRVCVQTQQQEEIKLLSCAYIVMGKCTCAQQKVQNFNQPWQPWEGLKESDASCSQIPWHLCCMLYILVNKVCLSCTTNLTPKMWSNWVYCWYHVSHCVLSHGPSL